MWREINKEKNVKANFHQMNDHPEKAKTTAFITFANPLTLLSYI